MNADIYAVCNWEIWYECSDYGYTMDDVVVGKHEKNRRKKHCIQK